MLTVDMTLLRSALALILWIGCPFLQANAQTAEPLPADSLAGTGQDSTVVQTTFEYGRSRTFRAILSETVLLQLSTDSRNLASATDPSLGIVGLLVDETLTPSGRLFYETFYLYWEPPPGAGASSLTIGELPLPGNGTAITIRSNGEAIVQARLPRRPEEIESLAQQAVAFLRQRL